MFCRVSDDTSAHLKSSSTQIMNLFREWQREQKRISELPPGISDADFEKEISRSGKIEEAIIASPSLTAADFAVKVLLVGGDALRDSYDGFLLSEAVALTGANPQLAAMR